MNEVSCSGACVVPYGDVADVTFSSGPSSSNTGTQTSNSTSTPNQPASGAIVGSPSQLAQSQTQGSWDDPNLFSVQEAVNGPVYYDNTQATQSTGSSSALNANYFSVAAIANMMSEDVG